MALEIERRFLVQGSGWRQHIRWQSPLRQGYLLADDAGLTVRVRLGAEGQAWLTLKAAAGAIARHEFEYPIPAADAEAMLALAPVQLTKIRYGLDLPGGDWVVDVFEGSNAPLVLAEVELEHLEDPLSPPPWCSREITGQHALSNAALALRPLDQWSEQERRPLLEALGLEG
ncbi:MAG: CYTH domain-containing protein [Cyanobacteriota bacterium]